MQTRDQCYWKHMTSIIDLQINIGDFEVWRSILPIATFNLMFGLGEREHGDH